MLVPTNLLFCPHLNISHYLYIYLPTYLLNYLITQLIVHLYIYILMHQAIYMNVKRGLSNYQEGGGGKLVAQEKEVRHIVTFLHIFTFRGRFV
jgi:hypothetical protein